jgi:hypothetical protein
MTAITTVPPAAAAPRSRPLATWATLAGRRVMLSALFPVTALPGWLAAVARALPTTHALALLRYGVIDHGGAGLHDIWGLGSTTACATLSLLVLAGWAVVVSAVSIRVFQRSAMN